MKQRVALGFLLAALLFATAPQATLAQAPIVHVVQPGENLYRIALRYGVDQQYLAAANGIVNPNCLYAGQRLIIPGWYGGVWPPPGPPPFDCYIVRYGDTLGRIAARFGASVQCLASVNHISNPNRIYAGQCLHIPRPGCQPPPPPPPRPYPYGWYPSPPPAKPPPCPSCNPCSGATPSSYWCAEFYSNGNLAGGPILQRLDSDIKFVWGYSAPAPGVPADNFSVRWTRTMGLAAGRYVIDVRADDGVRVYVDSNLVVDAWQVQSGTVPSGDLELRSSTVRTVVIEYFEADGAAEIEVVIRRVS